MQDIKQDHQQLSEQRTEIFEELSSALALHGQFIDMESYRLMQPLLSGTLGYGEHRTMLSQLAAGLSRE